MIAEAITPYTRPAVQLGGSSQGWWSLRPWRTLLLGIRHHLPMCLPLYAMCLPVYEKGHIVVFWQNISQVYFPETL